MSVAARLAELGVVLPESASTFGAYVPAVKAANLIFTSGQIPIRGGELVASGSVGDDQADDDVVGLELARECAKQCVVNALVAISTVVDLDEVEQVVKITGFVASADGFTSQPLVLDAASDFLIKIFGDRGRHARSAVGVAELPLGSPVEIELVVQVAG